jgi:hypothetical protein
MEPTQDFLDQIVGAIAEAITSSGHSYNDSEDHSWLTFTHHPNVQ